MAPHLIKLAVVGGEGVGKTCLVSRLVGDAFAEQTDKTCGVSFRLARLLPVDDGVGGSALSTPAKLHIWDLAGDPHYSLVADSYFRCIQAILLCYDVTRPASLDEVREWWQRAKLFAPANAQMVLCGTKSDSAADDETVLRGANLAANLGLPWVMTSAKNGAGVKEAFATIIRTVRSAAAGASNCSDLAPIRNKASSVANPSHRQMLRAAADQNDRPALVPLSSPCHAIASRLSCPASRLSCPAVVARFCGEACPTVTHRTANELHSMQSRLQGGSQPQQGEVVMSEICHERSGGAPSAGGGAAVGLARAPSCKRQLRA